MIGYSGHCSIFPTLESARPIPVECNLHRFRVPPVYLTLGFREVVSYVAFRIFNNLRLINDEAWFDSHPRLHQHPHPSQPRRMRRPKSPRPSTQRR
jgi:hypothetical protein